mmetsp:Transcript_44311/g.95085  ORF Transcript_44311/g.95085 Transcript_44311/m.95085 type:complete len:141 (-) Transcript_44311:907-1329(-)
MTSAHRPTWTAAVASGTNPSGTAFMCQTSKVANRDAAHFLKLKTRQAGQGLIEERGSRRELREDLEAREKKAREERLGISSSADSKSKPKAVENPFPEDADEDGPPLSDESDKGEKAEEEDDDDEEEEEATTRTGAKERS